MTPFNTGVPFLDLHALHRETGTELDAAWMSVRTANAFVGGTEVEHFEEAFATFCFYPGKNLGAFGDAGAVTTTDPAISRRVRTHANHGRVAGEWHRHDYAGCNSRLDALQAAILSRKLTRLERCNAQRRHAAQQYGEHLEGSRCRRLAQHPRATSVRHLQVVRVPERDHVLETRDARRIGWGLDFPVPVHRQPPFAQFASGSLPVVERAASEIVSLPMFPTIGRHDIENVCDALFAATEERDREPEQAR